VWAVALVAYIGFNAFNQVLAAQALHQLSASVSATSRPPYPVRTVRGRPRRGRLRQDHLAQRAFAYLMIAISRCSRSAGCCCSGSPLRSGSGGFSRRTVLAQLFAAASYQLSWSIYVSDYSRYCRATSGYGRHLVDVSRGFRRRRWMMLVGTVAAAARRRSMSRRHAARRRPGASRPGHGVAGGGVLGLITISA